MASNYAVETKRLTRSFRDREAVRELTLAVEPGEIFGLLGPNGSGKTTTVRMLLGLIAPTSGMRRFLDATFDPHPIRFVSGRVC